MRRLLDFIRSNLLAGLLIVGPLVATVFILSWLYFQIDPPVQRFVLILIGVDPDNAEDIGIQPGTDSVYPNGRGPDKISNSGRHPIRLIPINLDWLPDRLNPNVVNTSNGQYQFIFGLGLLVIFVFVLLVGFAARTFMGRWLFRTMEWVLNRIPIVKTIYSSFKQLTDTFLAQQPEQKIQKEVVLVEYPEPGSAAIGFVTGVAKGLVQQGALKLFNLSGQTITATPPPLYNAPNGTAGDDLLLVFIPMSPLPTGGFLVVVPRTKVVKIDITVEQAFQLIVSGGLVQPPEPAITEAMLPGAAQPNGRRSTRASQVPPTTATPSIPSQPPKPPPNEPPAQPPVAPDLPPI